jgi:O-acetyl-ADP-ribose deacetylase (regulator of RNase III)
MAILNMNGNIFDSNADIICHQVNCCGLMGSGIAKQVRSLYPSTFKIYKEMCDHAPNKSNLLGIALIDRVSPSLEIAHLFGQIVPSTVGIQTNYSALKKSLFALARERKGKKIAIPYGMGCGLAGGDWGIVSKIIENAFEYYNGEVEIWKLE